LNTETYNKGEELKPKALLTLLGIAALLVSWGISWANQNAKIDANSSSINTLTGNVANISSQATEADKAIVRMETKIEYIVKGVD
jgi:outer membrane murein-binding lipoprotein Lpp